MCDLSSHQHLVKVSALVTDERVNEAFGERRVEPDRSSVSAMPIRPGFYLIHNQVAYIKSETEWRHNQW